MKQALILASLFLSTTVATFASNGKSGSALKSKTISLTENFTKVSVGQNLKVVFTNDRKNEVSVTGGDKFLKDILITNKNGNLSITSTKNNSKPGVIYVSVSDLKSVVLENNAIAMSQGILDCKNLKVEIGDGSHAALRVRGKVELVGLNDTQLDIERFQSITEN